MGLYCLDLFPSKELCEGLSVESRDCTSLLGGESHGSYFATLQSIWEALDHYETYKPACQKMLLLTRIRWRETEILNSWPNWMLIECSFWTSLVCSLSFWFSIKLSFLSLKKKKKFFWVEIFFHTKWGVCIGSKWWKQKKHYALVFFWNTRKIDISLYPSSTKVG